VRALMTATAVAVCIALQYVDPWGLGSGPRALGGHLDLWELGTDLLVMALMWPLLPKVSYRRRDVLMMLVPFYGLWVVGLAVWRLSGLPFRDWRPRDDELPRIRLVRGGPLYVLVPVRSSVSGDDGVPGGHASSIPPDRATNAQLRRCRTWLGQHPRATSGLVCLIGLTVGLAIFAWLGFAVLHSGM
jgi:hypothetical protein